MREPLIRLPKLFGPILGILLLIALSNLVAAQTPARSIPWGIGGDPSEIHRPTWCENNQVWEEGRQGLSVMKADCRKMTPSKRCEMVTLVRNGLLASTAQCVSR